MKKPSAEKFLKEALTHVESESIRTWVQTDHNLPLWTQMAANAVQVGTEPLRFASYIVCVAIGA
jgi:hypothetical protein